MSSEVFRWNFITEKLTHAKEYVPLFLFFSKKDFLDPKTGDFSFKSLKPFQQNLVKLMLWLTRAFKGSVYMCYMEQLFIGNQTTAVPPALRCTLSSDVVFIFTLDKADLWGNDGSRDGSLLDLLFKDDLDTNLRYKDRMVHAVKKLICHHLLLISKEVLYTSSNDLEKESDLTDMVDWETSNYKMGAVDRKVVSAYGGMLFRLPAGNHEKFSLLTVFSAAARYFMGCEKEVDGSQVDPDFSIWISLSKFFEPSNSPVFRKFADSCGRAPVIDFLQRVHRGELSIPAHELLLFRYDPDELFNVHNFRAFESVSLYGYPHLDQSGKKCVSIDDHMRASVALGVITNCSPPSILDGVATTVIYPHLTPIIGISAAVDKSIGQRNKLFTLDLKIELFKNILLKNASKIPVEPISSIYGKLQKLLTRDRSPGLSLRHRFPMGFVCSMKSPDMAPRFMDTFMMKELFVNHMGCTRCGQAVTEFGYILYNTAPRWKQTRIMLVNYTRPGQGKTFTNSVIMGLLGPVSEIFDEISNFTATSFKYMPMTIGKVMFMDDVGFTSDQQKTIAREDNIIQNHFKCMLDKGYTNNNVTQWDATANKYGTNKIISIQNTGFVWNTNTLDPFGNALRDRSIILGPEPSTRKITAKGEGQVKAILNEKGLTELATTLFLRQQLIQTMIYTLTGEGGITSRHNEFLTDVLSVLGAHYPTFHTGSHSLARDHFKILDLAYADTIRVAITAVLDMWLPPWTVPPDFVDDETVEGYLMRLNRARLEALGEMELSAIIVEVLAQISVFLPSSIVQTATVAFNQETGAVLARVCEFLGLAMNNRQLEMVAGPHGTITINRPHMLDPHFEVDARGVFKMAKSVMILRGGERVKLVQGLKTRDGGGGEITMDGALILDLCKLVNPKIFTELWNDLIGAFEASGELTVWFLPQNVHTINILKLFHLLGTKGVYSEGDGPGFQVHRDFAGLSTELFRRGLDRDSAVNGVIPVDTSECVINLEPYAREVGGLDPSVITPDGVSMEFMTASFHATTIKKFGPGFINIPGIGTRFTHSRAAMYALGDEIKLCKARAGIPADHTEWEYKHAESVYREYMRTPITDVKGHLGRYLCATNSSDSLARDDSYLVALHESLGSVTYEDVYTRSTMEYAAQPEMPAPVEAPVQRKRRISADDLDLATKIQRLMSR
ncbi:ORF56 [Ictalurid herpesvirus 1]|nr:ORF56 [Ictalurid herpesvirus 1]